MKKLLVLVVALALMLPSALLAQEKQEKPPTPLQVYMKDKNPGTFRAAFEAYETARKDSTDNAATLMLAYLNLFELDRNLEMLKANMASLKNPQKFQYANILVDMGQYEEAIPIYKDLNEKSPKWSCPWRHRGTAHWKLKQYDEAVACLEKAIETRETHYDAYVIYANVLDDMKQYDRALQVLEKGLTYFGKDIEAPEKEVPNADVAFLYLDLLKKTGADAKYKDQLEQCKKLYPEDERLPK